MKPTRGATMGEDKWFASFCGKLRIDKDKRESIAYHWGLNTLSLHATEGAAPCVNYMVFGVTKFESPSRKHFRETLRVRASSR